jgi:hypothetical protein
LIYYDELEGFFMKVIQSLAIEEVLEQGVAEDPNALDARAVI